MTLSVADVFLTINPALSGSHPHFHIVVHRTAENFIVVTYTTTKIEEARRRCRRKERIPFDHIEPGSLVIVTPQDSESFSQICAIDCNNVQMSPEESYLPRPAFKLLKPIKNGDLILKIREAIKKSPVVEEGIMKLLR